jgi:hypothetical protein
MQRLLTEAVLKLRNDGDEEEDNEEEVELN